MAVEAAQRGPKRRLPLLAWAVLGAIAAGSYASLRMGMSFGPPLVMTALGGLTLVLGAGALWRVVDPLTRSELRQPTDVRAPHRIRELEREKQAVLKAIKEIELDYQMRKISEPDYQEMIERYRTRALRVLGDLAAGDDYRVLIERELKGRLLAIDRVGQKGRQEGRQEGKQEGRQESRQEGRAEGTAQDRADDEVEDSAPAAISSAAPVAVSVSVPAETISPGDEPARCRGCETVNDADAQFCKRCGKNLRTLPSVPA